MSEINHVPFQVKSRNEEHLADEKHITQIFSEQVGCHLNREKFGLTPTEQIFR